MFIRSTFLALLALAALPVHAASSTGSITAAGQTVIMNVYDDANISAAIDIGGTFTGGEFAFEVSLDAGVNWRPIRPKRSTSDVRESTTATLAGNPGYYWTAGFGPVRIVRVRCIALASGTVDIILRGNGNDVANLEVGPIGLQGLTGSQGVAGVNSFGAGTAITPTIGTAFQAADPAKPSFIAVNVTSTATISLSGGQTHSAQLVIAPSGAAACSAGTGSRILGRYSNSNTGALTVGLNLSTISETQLQAGMPAGYFACVRSTSGTPSIVSAFEQPVG